MARSERVVLVDGSALIFRAYFAIPGNLSTSQGLHTNAVFGFATMFRKLLGGKRPVYGAVVFDAPGKTFRDEKYPEYKAARPRMADDLVEQLPWIDKVVEGHGFPILRVPGFEADDVIGTLTREALEAGHEVFIVSGDKDFAQLIEPRVRMLDTLRDITYDEELVRKKWGIAPAQFVDFLALMGDAVDNIPGVPGIGKKGAAKLLATYETLDGILEHVAELKGRQKKTLEENREQAILSKELATIEQRVPLEKTLTDLLLPEVPPEQLNVLYRELEFYSLLSEEARAEDAADDADATYLACASADEARAALTDALASAGDAPLALEPCFDTPDTGPLQRLVGLAFAGQAGTACYLPFAGPHESGSLADPAWAFLVEYLGDAARPKVAHGAKSLWLGLRRQGVPLAGVVFDTGLASYLIEPTKLIPHRLDQLVKQYLHRTLRPLKSVIGSGKKQVAWEEADLETARDHACHRVDAVVQLLPILSQRLDEEGQTKNLNDVELPLSWVLGGMEHTGIKVDVEDLNRLGEEFGAELTGYEATIHELAGRPFNINSTKQLSAVLFEELELPVIKRTKTGYSTNVEVLERLAKEHPIAEQVLEYRKLAKLINTYTDVLQRAAHPETHRIHATFQQTVGASGRVISTEPDLQRTPVKTARGSRIRRTFVAEPEHQLIAADWSQIELRLMAHVSEDPLLVESFQQALDVHARTAGQLFHCEPAQVTPAQRRVGKTINFATIYGQGATALSQILKIPRKEAAQYIDRFFEAYSEVRVWLDDTKEEALEKGYVTTLLGRRRYIPELSSNNKMIQQAGVRMAANTPLQGSVADICKLAMIEIDRRLRAQDLRAQLLLQIHDELVLEAPSSEVEPARHIVRDVMEHVVELKVPLVVDVGVGPTWADAK